MPTITPGTCFLPRQDGSVQLIVNWDRRINPGDPMVLIRLSPRHRAIWRTLRRRGRSDKSICYALFGRARARGSRVGVPIDLHDHDDHDLIRLAQAHLRSPVPGLDRLGRTGLLALVRALYRAMPSQEARPARCR